MLVLSIVVAGLSALLLVVIGVVIDAHSRLNRHHKLISKNLDLIESVNRNIAFADKVIKSFVTQQLKYYRDEQEKAQYDESARIYEVILANAKGLQDQIQELRKDLIALLMERTNQSNILIENRTALLDWDLRRHELQNVVRDLIDYLELDWQLQQSEEKTIFSKREGKKKKS